MSILKEWNKKLIYCDIFTLFSYDWVEDENGGTYQKQRIHPEIVDAPCYLSISKNALGNSYRLDQPRNKSVDRNTVERVLTLFCDPLYEIKAGDCLRVVKGGETFEFITGEPHKYSCYQEMLVYSLLDA